MLTSILFAKECASPMNPAQLLSRMLPESVCVTTSNAENKGSRILCGEIHERLPKLETSLPELKKTKRVCSMGFSELDIQMEDCMCKC